MTPLRGGYDHHGDTPAGAPSATHSASHADTEGRKHVEASTAETSEASRVVVTLAGRPRVRRRSHGSCRMLAIELARNTTGGRLDAPSHLECKQKGGDHSETPGSAADRDHSPTRHGQWCFRPVHAFHWLTRSNSSRRHQYPRSLVAIAIQCFCAVIAPSLQT